VGDRHLNFYELRDNLKLDATTTPTVSADSAVAVAGISVANGPEGDLTDWLSIDWRVVERDVRRLRQRIFTASQAGDLKRAAICRS
jgi:RNA-directed DNA polymerase